MKNKLKIVWTVSQDGGRSVCGAYAGKNAKRAALRESGGISRRMTVDGFRALYSDPQKQITTLG